MADALVEEAIRRYHALLEQHVASTRATLDAHPEVQSHVLRPCFLTNDTYTSLLETTGLLNRALLNAAERLTRDPALRRKLAIPEYLEPLFALDAEHGAPPVVGRFDGIVDRSGAFQMIEYNAVPGFDAGELAARVFAEAPIHAAFAEEYAFHTPSLLDLAADALLLDQEKNGRGGAPVIGVPFTDEKGLPDWITHATTRGCRVVEAPYEDFLHEGGRLVTKSGVEIDTVLPGQSDLLRRVGSPLPLFDAIKAGSVRLIFGLSRGFLASYKNTLEILTDLQYASFFEPEVAAAIRRHVPWTRVVRNGKTTHRGLVVDLLPFVAENRQHMVLKPSGGRMGSGVLLGWQCTDAVWKQTLKRALHQPYVVQERVVGVAEPYPRRVGAGLELEDATSTFEPLVWNGTKPAGALVRVSATGRHNLADGCSIPPLWILDGRRTAPRSPAVERV